MNTPSPLGDPVSRLLARIAGEDGGIVQVSLTQPDTLAVLEINGRNEK